MVAICGKGFAILAQVQDFVTSIWVLLQYKVQPHLTAEVVRELNSCNRLSLMQSLTVTAHMLGKIIDFFL